MRAKAYTYLLCRVSSESGGVNKDLLLSFEEVRFQGILCFFCKC
jgi:hypothetical protein